VNISKGWALTLGVFLGYELAKLKDQMPFIVSSLNEIRDLMWTGSMHAGELGAETPDDDEGAAT
jgi:hypothetical protein